MRRSSPERLRMRWSREPTESTVERFRYLAEHDELTGLLNRRAVLLALEREIVRASRDRTAVTIVLGDLDHFKQVNDVYGHLAGDAALRRFASALSESMRPYDSAGRYGGEEFLLVLPGISTADVKDRLSVLHEAISNLAVQEVQADFRITCSLGAVVVVGAEDLGDQGAALAAADCALYEAKETGRNRVVLHLLPSDRSMLEFRS
jgi:two-component system cell cycle response regulator